MPRKMFMCIDAHTCGNPVRVVAGGAPPLHGESIFKKRLHFLEEYDWIRKGLMFEPRGHDMMSGSILYPPSSPENDVAVLFIETSGCLPMCGHGTIGTITVAIEEGLVVPKVPGQLKMEAPAGLIHITYQQEDKKVKSVKLVNVPSYLAATGLEIDFPSLGKLVFDVAYGGNYYAIIEPQKHYPGLQEVKSSEIVMWSPHVRKLVNQHFQFEHPENPKINGVSHIMWTGNPQDKNADGRNAVFYGDRAIDRSPCGTGTSARMAQLYSKGELQVGDTYVHESIIGSKFIGRVEEETQVGKYKAIIPSIEGWARITGYNNIIIDDDDDPYAYGFQLK